MEWFEIENIDQVDSPALVLYKQRMQENIRKAVLQVKDPARLRPHMKTNKILEVARMMMGAGISKFKCATIAEAEMLGMAGAKDVLLAYQPVGPKAQRFLSIINKYPATNYSCLVDDISVAAILSNLFSTQNRIATVYIDINSGMNRTGISATKAFSFLDELLKLNAILVGGIHSYDGHLTMVNNVEREHESDVAYEEVRRFADYFETKTGHKPHIVAGGSTTFPAHTKREVECSPGTFVFWDWGYFESYPSEPFDFAAVVVTRVVSIVSGTLITTDLGYKSIACENPLQKRLHFLNAPGAELRSQSEEHLSVIVPDTTKFAIGDVLYAVPVHICPTVALYEKAYVADGSRITESWKVIARDRSISV